MVVIAERLSDNLDVFLCTSGVGERGDGEAPEFCLNGVSLWILKSWAPVDYNYECKKTIR